MKFKEGDIVKHKLSKEKYVIVRCEKKGLFRRYNEYLVTNGIIITYQYGDKRNNYLNMYESELENTK